VQAMICCLDLVSENCPSVGQRGVDVAKQYWVEGASIHAEVEKARIACWDYVDGDSALADEKEISKSAVDAVICVLHPEAPSDDIGELVEWFLQRLRDAVPDKTEDTFSLEVLTSIDRSARHAAD
jgi:hypothetical protein